MTLRAGIIGAGGVAGMGIYGADNRETGTEPTDSSHAGGYRDAEGIELVAIADVDDGRLRRFGEAWDVPESGRYPDHASMLESTDLDVVSVCTPSMLHHDHVVDAAELGDPGAIWCEKPVACSVADAEAMVAASDDAGVELVVNHSRRFMRQHGALRAAIDDGLLGEVRTGSASVPMELLRVGTHMVDLVCYLLDDRAAEVGGFLTGENEAAEDLGASDVDDCGGGGYVRTRGDAYVTFDAAAPRALGDWHARLVGTEGRLVSDDRGWTLFDRTDEGHVERPAPTGDHHDSFQQAFVNAAEHCVALVEDDAENRSPGHEAIYPLEILVGFAVSEYTGGMASIPLSGPMADVTIRSW
jgi:predicted dehydrogenase